MSEDVWQKFRLSQVGRVITGGTPDTQNEKYWGGTIPFATPADFFGPLRLNRTERFLTPEGARLIGSFPKDSVLVTCIGTIGKIKIANSESGANQQINALICNEGFDPEFVANAISIQSNQLAALAGTTTLPIVNGKRFASLTIACPAYATQRLQREKIKAKPEMDLIRRISFLKVVVVVSGDPTNELAAITAARKEARSWNAVGNFCKRFDFADSEKTLTGIAFLIVCDMLLTGFDAPVEQVMYIDKKLHEHNLLQAIARVNRVSKGKQRGFIVDYIGLANHLTEALSIYTNEDAQDIQQGLQSLLSELPILEERYQRLLQQFHSAGIKDIELFVKGQLPTPETEVAVVHAAVGAMKEIKPRADFEVYLNKFLQSLNLILPNAAGHPYRGPARRFGYLLRMVKERYKDESLDITDAGEKVKALINEHLIDLGINPKIPPIELLSDDFLAHVRKHSQDNPEAKASEMEHAIRKHCTIHFDEDPAFYKRLSDKLEKLIEEHKNNWQALAEGYEALRMEAMGGRIEVVEGLNKEATTFYDYVVQLAFDGKGTPQVYQQPIKKLMIQIVDTLQDTIDIIDFWKKPIEVKRLRGNIDTEILLANIPELNLKHERLAVEIVKLAEKRHGELTK